jgi:hypothetical protein
MNEDANALPRREPTPVDDVRRVRQRLSRESAGDIRRQIQQANQVAEHWRQKLGLKWEKRQGHD